MAEPYPFKLTTIQQASKSRSQPASFSMAEPRRGYGYAQAVGSDTPVFWDVVFKFTRGESARFQIWFTQVIARGLTEFILPIKTEFGTIDHTCRFLPDGLGDAQESGQCWTYTAKIMARAQIIPQAFIDAQEFILELENWDAWAEVLDMSIATMPEA